MKTTLSHYTVQEQIGVGGMGVVYRAHDMRLDRDVAIKVLPTGALADESARKRFRKEAIALSKLNHANIATVHDFDSENGIDFLVEELIGGLSLSTILASGPLDEREVIALGGQLCAGLAAAHHGGVIHCDLKPANIKVTPDAQLKILDFGLAKILSRTRENQETEATASVTDTHAFSGTIPYMAPEQLLGQTVGPQADIWATGCVLYEMATARRPFLGTGPALTEAILHQQVPLPSKFSPKISAALEGIILKCLEKDPALRYQSAKELLVDFRRVQGVQIRRTRVQWSRRKWAALGVGFFAATSLVSWVLHMGGWADRARSVQSQPPRIESLAVLPIVNLSGNSESDYFADGMTEELIASLGKLGVLRVISRTSVMHYRGTKQSLPSIARELNVDAVVEGSVLRSGNRVRITAQLIQAKEDRQLWSESYERDISDILALQSDVARDIAERIRLKVLPYQHKLLASTHSLIPAAYEAYLQGRYYWNKRSREGVLRGLEYFKEAVRLDSNYALAYAGIADSYLVLVDYHWLSSAEAVPQARIAALKALSIDESLPEAHTSMASIASTDWDWPTAEKEYLRALELNPNYATARFWYSMLLAQLGRPGEAVVEAKRAAEIDPLSPIINNNVGEMLYLNRQYKEALTVFTKINETYPNFMAGWYCTGEAYVQTGRFDEAIAALKRAAMLSPKDGMVMSALIHAYGTAGWKAQARELLEQWKKSSDEGYLPGFLLGQAYVGLGENQSAIRSLERAYHERDTQLKSIGADPVYDPLRSNPRFQGLLRRMNLPQGQRSL